MYLLYLCYVPHVIYSLATCQNYDQSDYVRTFLAREMVAAGPPSPEARQICLQSIQRVSVGKDMVHGAERPADELCVTLMLEDAAIRLGSGAH